MSVFAKGVSSQAGAELGAVCLPMEGETACGDSWAVHHSLDRTLLLVVDGLGHGDNAADAADLAVAALERCAAETPQIICKEIDRALHRTRGAAALIVEIDWRARLMRHCGIGNIAGRLWSNSRSESLLSLSGTLGVQVRRFEEIASPLPKEVLLILHSDGVSSRWSLDAYPGLQQRHPLLIAGVLYRDFHRERDDCTVVVLKEMRRSL